MRRFRRALGGLTCAAVLALPGAATALSLLNFNLAPNSGSLSHLAAAGPLDGSGLEIASIHSLSSPLNSGATLACVGCKLTFATGNRLSFSSAGGVETWSFDQAGSSLTIKGTIPSIGIAALTTLLDATFAEDVVVTRFEFTSFTVASGVHAGSVDLGLANYFGEIHPALESGGMSIQSTVPSVGAGGTFTSSTTLGGIATANVVPEPETAFLLALGLIGLGFAGRADRLQPK